MSCLANVSTDLEIRYPDSRKRIETVVLPFYAFPKWLHGFLFSQLHPQFKPPVQKKFLFGQKFDYFAICRSSEFVEIYDPEKIKGNKRV